MEISRVFLSLSFWLTIDEPSPQKSSAIRDRMIPSVWWRDQQKQLDKHDQIQSSMDALEE